MVDNPVYGAGRKLEPPKADYLGYNPPPRNSSTDSNFTLGYHRSSSSSSSAGSGKQLVHSHQIHNSNPLYGRFDRRSYYREDRNYPSRRDGLREDSSSSGSSPEIHKKTNKFFIGPPSSPGSSRSSYTPRHSSPEPPSTPGSTKLDRLPNSLSPNFIYDHQGRIPSPKPGKISSIYENYWHIPRPNLWCSHKGCSYGKQKCSQCQLKEETSSSCSSENPPPTFTAFDNYQPVKRRSKTCTCGAIFFATMALSVLVLMLITAFIVYIEMVIKKNQYVPDPM